MVSGKTSKVTRGTRTSVVTKKGPPWGLIAAVTVVVLFAAAIFGYAFLQSLRNEERDQALAPFTPTAENQDPSAQIEGVQKIEYAGGLHVNPDQQVAYTHSPPFGGAHDGFWAACNGVVYPEAVRNENMVHSLEHGAIWIAYNPDLVTGDALAALQAKADGQPYTMISPYPGLDTPVSLQSWGHQLKLTDPADIRVDQFIQSLRRNQYTHPEFGASCNALGPGQFDQDAPPPFQPAPAPGTPGAQPETAGDDAVAPDPGQ
jgi:hypothetical protein